MLNKHSSLIGSAGHPRRLEASWFWREKPAAPPGFNPEQRKSSEAGPEALRLGLGMVDVRGSFRRAAGSQSVVLDIGNPSL